MSLTDRLQGLLFFPVTAFDRAGRADLGAFRAHVRTGLDAGAGAVFACCGTGEFWALGLDEYEDLVRAAVHETDGRVPVVAGVGHGLPIAAQFAAAAARAGADGLLAMPPYLAVGTQPGLRDHYRRLADESALDVIVYQRDNAVFTPETVADLAAHERIVGFKDGLGDLDLMRRIVAEVRTRHGDGALHYFNGMPTAEMTSQAYKAVGVPSYSSAVFCFAPDIALAYHRAYTSGDDATAARLLDGFFTPYVDLRRQGGGGVVA